MSITNNQKDENQTYIKRRYPIPEFDSMRSGEKRKKSLMTLDSTKTFPNTSKGFSERVPGTACYLYLQYC